ncbi:MAG TPA: fused MFS/spermidine synthase, partial [Candidatus Thermoplasmatota archaeon]|nr:fused MFS/spermidine synthase [Candidatus Thermoplasmatota archaeon]
LAGARETWDVIVLDAYGRDYVPFHLMTLEFLRIVRDHLAPGGVLLTNLIGSREGPASTLLRSEAFTLSQVFPWTQHVPTRSDLGPYMVEETIIVASQAAPERWARLAAYPDEGVEMPKVHDARILADLESMRLSLEGVPTLTDHFAPVETFLSPVTMESFRAAG